jgi:predicted transcriptional regulator of viral defense system
MESRRKGPPDYEALYRIAEPQAGYFTAAQAAHAGFSWERLSYYAGHGRFRRVTKGIYRLVHFPASPFEDLFKAWLRCGPRSVISHDSALAVYNLSDLIPGEVHVTVPRSSSRRRPGIRLHTSKLRPSDVKTRDGLRVTTVPRTIADIAAAGLAEEHVRQSIREALHRGLTDPKSLLAETLRRKGRAPEIIRDELARWRTTA